MDLPGADAHLGGRAVWLAVTPSDFGTLDTTKVEAAPNSLGVERFEILGLDVSASTIRGVVPATAVVPELRWDRSRLAAETRHEIWISVDPANGSASGFVAIAPDGTVAYIGECAFEEFTQPMTEYHAQLQGQGDERTQAELLRGLIEDQDQLQGFADFLYATPPPV